MIVFTRVDDRLIHGQIVQGWLPSYNIEEVIVVARGLSPMAAKLMRMSLPDQYRFKAGTPEEMSEYVKESDSKKFVIVYDTPALEAMIEMGADIKDVNIGGIHYKEGREKLYEGVYLGEEDRGIIRDLIRRGIKIDSRAVPRDKNIDMEKIIS
ncbi:PTS system protein [Parelusimicrobium proximum]|uniref:PTS system mannose/fructose/N-acetylgalactosamine-transporter subunit IIB n=1 Tax=Parelusimicrobium proximum TaxID=3228953 RepID=UPI003D167EE4